ncbi:MAG: DHHW family protein, partial [Oscillospiraceae bacterium]
MLYKRVTSLIMLVIVIALGVGIIWQGFAGKHPFPDFTVKQFIDGDFNYELEHYAKENFVLKENLQSFAIGTKLLAGQTEQQDIFIGNDILIEDQPSPNDEYVDDNTNALLNFAKKSTVPVYAMLIPTKCAIQQQSLPEIEYISLFNQKEFMEKIYDKFSGKISSVDPYPTLFSNQNQYIYYKTDPNLTALGGYYVYSVLANRLNVGVRPISDFSIEHINHKFYGQTFNRSPYKDINPDMISIYHFDNNRYSYAVTHNKYESSYTYNTLYPTQWSESDMPLNIYLGGNTGDINIKAYGGGNGRKLLVFGDDSMLPVITLLSTNYDEVRFIDLSKLEPTEIYGIDVNYYDQV